jgi:hypothetical protein
MKKTSKPHKVVLLSGQLTDSDGGPKAVPLLPAMRFGRSTATAQGLIQLDDGAYRQIFEIDGFSLSQFQQDGEALENQFKGLIDGLDCDLQLLITSRPYPIGSWEEFQKQFAEVKDDYLKWYLDYQYRWFTRVCGTYIPRRRSYAVLTSRAGTSKSERDAARRKAFKLASDACLSRLRQIGQNPQRIAGENARLLLYQYFLMPPVKSQSYQSPGESGSSLLSQYDLKPTGELQSPVGDKLAKCLSPSTIMEPEIVESREWLKIGDNYHGSFAVTHLPAEISTPWLYWPIIEVLPYTVSVHLQPCAQKPTAKLIAEKFTSKNRPADLKAIAAGKARAVDVSVYVSTYGSTEGELKDRLELARANFAKKGATTGAAAGRQRELWRATLPVGLNEPHLAHRVSSQAASTFWPCLSDVPLEEKGIAFGFGLASNAPVFVNPQDKSDHIIVAANSEDSHSLMTLLAMKYLSAGMKVVYVGASDYPGVLTRVLGPQGANTIAVDESRARGKDLTAALCHLQWQKNSKISATTGKNLLDAAQAWSAGDGHNKAIFIEDISLITGNKALLPALQKLLAKAKAKGISVFVSVEPKHLARVADLNHDFVNKIVFRPAAADLPYLKKYLKLNYMLTRGYPKKGKDNLPCALLKGDSLWYMSLLWTPMDAGLLARSHIYGQSNVKLKALRQKLLKDVRQRNPKMAESDVWRQAIYYFGLQHGA